MNHNNKLQLSILIITLVAVIIIGCDSNNDVSQEPIEPEEVVKPELEETVIEEEAEPEEIADDEPEEEVIEEEPEIKAVVNVDVLRLRSGPSTDHEILDRLSHGTVLKVTGREGEWLEVITSRSREGWVHGDYISKPEDPEKLYEVLSVKVQPVGYAKERIASFIEESTSFKLYDFILPEFDHPNEISNEDLIRALTLSGLAPSYNDFYSISIMTGKDIQETARSIFGSDIEEIEHTSVFPYYWNSENQIYQVEGFGPGSYTNTKVINVRQTSEEFIVDAVHLIYYYSPQATEYISQVVGELSRISEYDSYEDFLENSDAIVLVDDQHTDGTIEKHIETFPVRRYILSKEGDGVCYIRQSYLVDD